jgi:citrate lyase subunit beta/citryl-CoA lyase
MPASNTSAVEKARTLPCDAVILDLEDGVAPEAKETARAQAIDAVRSGGFGRREVVIRANGLETPWGEADLAALAELGPDAILVPKISDSGDVARYDGRIARAPAHTSLWAMVETCRSLFHLDTIAGATKTSRLSCLVIGTNDLAKEMGARPGVGREPFLGALGLSVAAAKAYGLAIIDGVFNDLEDEAGFEAQCRQGRDFGFDGKTLIHPRQIDPCNRIFSPSREELADAQAVVDAFAAPENAGRGAIRVNGRMAERLHLLQAERLLAMASA